MISDLARRASETDAIHLHDASVLFHTVWKIKVWQRSQTKKRVFITIVNGTRNNLVMCSNEQNANVA